MYELNDTQLELKATDFINDYKNSSSAEISKIIAGMTSIIQENETAYEQMRKQKWFERIWYGITGKNKATVKEMQANRDLLTKYIVCILVKMQETITEHNYCIQDLYYSISIVCNTLDNLSVTVDNLAHKLNEKITSVDNYNLLITQIQNNEINSDTPLISLLDALSMLDYRIANDNIKMTSLKKTMEKEGFDFFKEIDILTYSNELFSLSDEKVGRISLFSQRHMENNRFLMYTNYLINEYCYLGETDKRIVRENGEAVNTALNNSRLNKNAVFVLNEVYNDLIKEIQEDIPILKTHNTNITTLEKVPDTRQIPVSSEVVIANTRPKEKFDDIFMRILTKRGLYKKYGVHRKEDSKWSVEMEYQGWKIEMWDWWRGKTNKFRLVDPYGKRCTWGSDEPVSSCNVQQVKKAFEDAIYEFENQ